MLFKEEKSTDYKALYEWTSLVTARAKCQQNL